jgi:uncharacterized protein with von Willebrand factor type A (vWA) domain
VGNQTGVVLIADLSMPLLREMPSWSERSHLLLGLARTLGPAVKGIVRYSEVARLASSVDDDDGDPSRDWVYGANLQHAIMLARDACKKSGADRIVVIVSSFPSAHLLPGDGAVFFNYPPVVESIQATLEEASLLVSEDVRLDAVVLGDCPDCRDEQLSEFMARMTGPTGGIVMTASDQEPVEAVVGRFLTQSQLD